MDNCSYCINHQLTCEEWITCLMYLTVWALAQGTSINVCQDRTDKSSFIRLWQVLSVNHVCFISSLLLNYPSTSIPLLVCGSGLLPDFKQSGLIGLNACSESYLAAFGFNICQLPYSWSSLHDFREGRPLCQTIIWLQWNEFFLSVLVQVQWIIPFPTLLYGIHFPPNLSNSPLFICSCSWLWWCQ